MGRNRDKSGEAGVVSAAAWSLGEETGRGGVLVEIEGAGGGGWMFMLGARCGGGGGGKQARGGHTVTVRSDVTPTCPLGAGHNRGESRNTLVILGILFYLSINSIKLNPTGYFSKHASYPSNQSIIGCIYDQLALAIMIYMLIHLYK
jgi:hypothetical protein